MDRRNKTKNDLAWEQLFNEHKILEEVARNGFFEIKTNEVNKVRESRLMAKFDHYVNLPKIFKDNNLSILPVSRSKYVIGYFKTHCKVQYSNEVEEIPFELPAEIESIDCSSLYSESAALNCAFNSEIIDDLIHEKTFYTISGRMSTEVFDFNIESSLPRSPYPIRVENSQCEIDGGFESENYLLLIEAKNYSVDDFLIRQLYYPYRLWSAKVAKKVLPILMTYSNDVFSFFVYEFIEPSNYNSLRLLEQKNYVVAPENIELNDVSNIFDNLTLVPEPDNIPFPQADKFERVVDLLSLLIVRDLTKEEITENYQFDMRQTQYYTDACRYIKLVNKYIDTNTGEMTFCLTEEGRYILTKKHKAKFLLLIKKILQQKVFYDVFKWSISYGEIPSTKAVCEIMSRSDLGINDTTIRRRASTVRSWVDWIWSQIH